MTRITEMREENKLKLLDSKNINTLVQIRGFVVNVSSVIPELKEPIFRCLICQNFVQGLVDSNKIVEPGKCKKCGEKNTYVLMTQMSYFRDKQVVKLQESPENMGEGETPFHTQVILYDDLIDCCVPGDSVQVVGIFKAQPQREI